MCYVLGRPTWPIGSIGSGFDGALLSWVGPITQWVNPARSQPGVCTSKARQGVSTQPNNTRKRRRANSTGEIARTIPATSAGVAWLPNNRACWRIRLALPPRRPEGDTGGAPLLPATGSRLLHRLVPLPSHLWHHAGGGREWGSISFNSFLIDQV